MPAGPLKFHPFGSRGDPLMNLAGTQAVYLRRYLGDLGALTVLEEPAYFDRDYLSEFMAFYGMSARGYPNRCRRLHFFAGKPLTLSRFRRAAGGSERAAKALQSDYLGFVVLRPIPSAPLGRTVLKWYPDRQPPRVTDPWRDYESHIAGLTLKVRGLAWQQQDSAVGACATVALWSMLHSSAFDDHHAIPTTAEITRLANRTASLGARVFPSTGLSVHQLCEAIKEAGLAPVVVEGDEQRTGSKFAETSAFSRAHFASACASLLRSGYPVLVLGELEGEGLHAVCAVGFRETAPTVPGAPAVELQDEKVEFFYIHDDNVGPSTRMAVTTDPATGAVRLKASTPPRLTPTTVPDPTAAYPAFIPARLVAAVHQDLRTSPELLHVRGLEFAQDLRTHYNDLRARGVIQGGPTSLGLTLGTRFMRLHRYVDEIVGQTLKPDARAIARVRLALLQDVDPMGLHVGVVRIGHGARPLVDVLYDTTDSDGNMAAFCYVAYQPIFGALVDDLQHRGVLQAGQRVDAC